MTKAIFDTGATSCMSLKTFKRIYPKGNSQNNFVDNCTKHSSASGSNLKKEGKFLIPLNIGGKEHTIPVTVLTNLSCEMLLVLDFMHKTGLSYDTRRREFFQNDKNTYWKTANMELSENITLNPISNAVVTINVVTRDQARPNKGSTALASVNSLKHVVSGRPALIKINRMGQARWKFSTVTLIQLPLKEIQS